MRIGIAVGVFVSLVSSVPGVVAEPGNATSGESAFLVRLRQSRDGYAVSRALQGAYRRLAEPGCQAVFSDFTESRGRKLQEVLDEEGETGRSHLRRLYFYEGGEARGCKAGVLAFTQPGSRVIYVCSRWFREAYETNPARVEAVVIHESLHALGLGENPPRSQDITAQVVERCFR